MKTRKMVIVPFHQGKELPIDTLKAIENGFCLIMKTLERQLRRSNAERWNDERSLL